MTCPRPHCGGLILERVGLDADIPYRQMVCSACSRVITVPIKGLYPDRPVQPPAPRITLHREDRRCQKRQSEKLSRSARYDCGLCTKSGCQRARAPNRTQCQPHLDAMAAYSLARYHRLKQAAKT